MSLLSGGRWVCGLSLALLCSGCLLGQNVPTPESVLGHKPGDDYYLANFDESRAYFHRLAASSNRIKLINVGKTSRGLDWEIAVISSPENLAKLDHYKEISRRLALGRGLDEAGAKQLAREGKVFVHIDGGMHSSEVAGAQQSIALAYKLVSSEGDPQVDAILDNVILLLWPTLNPDGQNEIVAWYRKNLGTSYEVSPLPDLYQEYVGHDNNRDGYMQNMLESQEVTKAELEWNPAIFYCHHQTAPFPTRIFIPPFTEPISSNINPLMARWLNVLGMNIAAYLDEHDMPGAVHRVGFDNWYPGFLDFTHIFRNSISFFTETALYRYATPHFFTVDEFPKERQDLRSEMFYSSPWKGGWWRLSDAVRYMEGASMSVLDTAAKYREVLLLNRYRAAQENIQRFQKEPPYAYVIPQDQRDLPEAAVLVQRLLLNGIEVHQAAQAFRANGREYKNAWVVLMDQPFSPLVKELFEPQQYPDLRAMPGGPPIRPYDVAGWTLPMQMGVDTAAVLMPVSEEQRAGLKLVSSVGIPPGSVDGHGSAYSMGHEPNASFAAMNDVFAAGGKVAFVPDSGRVMVSGVDGSALAQIAVQRGVKLKAESNMPANAVSEKKPRVGLYRAWVPIIDEGWTRWILQNYGFAPVTLRNGDIQAGHLSDRFDAIILPDAMPKSITDGFSVGVVPGEYVGGLGESGSEALRQFVRTGGTLIAFNNASLYAISALNLPVTNVLDKLTADQFYCSGSLLRVELKSSSQPGVWGLPAAPIVMFERGPAFDTKPDFKGDVLATYPKERNPLESGYLLHPEVIQGKVAAVEAFYGSGRVYLLGFRPQWRAQSHGTYQFVFDAIYDSPASSKPTSLPKQAGGGQSNAWTGTFTKIHADLASLLEQNRAFASAKGAKAVDEKSKLTAAVDRFEKTDITDVEDKGAEMAEPGPRRATEYAHRLRKAAEDLRTTEFEANVTFDGLLEKYQLTQSETQLKTNP
jgi:hypothetical protein